MKKFILLLTVLLALVALTGCSSSNLNGIMNKEEALYGKVGLDASGKPISASFGYGKVDTKIIPMARGQGLEDTTVFCSSDGKPTYVSRMILYPIGQDAVLKIDAKKKPLFEIFGIGFGEKDGSLMMTIDADAANQNK